MIVNFQGGHFQVPCLKLKTYGCIGTPRNESQIPSGGQVVAWRWMAKPRRWGRVWPYCMTKWKSWPWHKRRTKLRKNLPLFVRNMQAGWLAKYLVSCRWYFFENSVYYLKWERRSTVSNCFFFQLEMIQSSNPYHCRPSGQATPDAMMRYSDVWHVRWHPMVFVLSVLLHSPVRLWINRSKGRNESRSINCSIETNWKNLKSQMLKFE